MCWVSIDSYSRWENGTDTNYVKGKPTNAMWLGHFRTTFNLFLVFDPFIWKWDFIRLQIILIIWTYVYKASLWWRLKATRKLVIQNINLSLNNLIFLFNIFLLQEEYARLQQENRERQMEVRHTALMFNYSHWCIHNFSLLLIKN